MGIVEEIRKDREDLARVLKKHVGIRKIVEDLYPDSAHFIYELLQNAEDTEATEATFTLSNSCLTFEHNGRPFEPADIEAITDIGEGTKEKDEDKIGRFGIGFKAVFAYTETPRIWSPTFAFQIDELVLPSKLIAKPELGKITRFEFPFNNPKKSPDDAYQEIIKGLEELSETTLLFLSHIDTIRWIVIDWFQSKVLRIPHAEHHVEIIKQTENDSISSSHYLRFTHPVDGMEKQNVAVAFELETLPKNKGFNIKKELATQYKIAPANPGQVAVFFPAQKETSGLRFHLHAPFVPELSRASIKETPANQPLFLQLAKLVVTALIDIRNLRLLIGDFLAVLPNLYDDIPERYQPIREAIIYAMNEQPLTPTYSKSHAPAKYLLQAKASLKRILTLEDLAYLVDYYEKAPKWAIGARQKNDGVDRFLTGLAISEWGIEEFVEVLEENLPAGGRWDSEEGKWIKGPDSTFLAWVSSKSEEWHQKLYALLYRELEGVEELYRLEKLCIVRLWDGEYRIGKECYFPTDDVENDDILPRATKMIYTSGSNKTEQGDARKLLEAIGVRAVGELEQVEAILKGRYTEESEVSDWRTYKRDLWRFMSLVEDKRENARLFKDYYIFKCSDGYLWKPSFVYLDKPYLDTNLSVYYKGLGGRADKHELTGDYMEVKLSKERFVSFAVAVGVSAGLSIEKRSTQYHPRTNLLRQDSWRRYTNTKIDSDWSIKGLDSLLVKPAVQLSKLIWNTMLNAPRYVWEAKFRPNQQYPTRVEPSSLALCLRSSKWIPQGNDKFVIPTDAIRELLPEGFPFDPGWQWLYEIHFGQNKEQQSKEHRRKREVAKELGFEDDDSLDDAKWFASLGSEERQQFKREYESRGKTELPEREPGNPDRRATRVGEQAGEAPERITDKRTRSVSLGREAVKKESDPYLRQQYSNNDGEMICQVCKEPLPFKLDNGNYYFETVEFLPELKNRHYQNYLALCPNHAAMYRYANDSMDLMKEMFLDLDESELELVLAEENTTLYFTRIHILDLKTVIVSEKGI